MLYESFKIPNKKTRVQFNTCVDSLMLPPKDNQTLIPRACECYLHGKGDFADGINIRILRQSDDPRLSGKPSIISKAPEKVHERNRMVR